MTFASSKWAGAAHSFQELSTLCQLESCVLSRSGTTVLGRSLGHVDVVVPAELGLAPMHPWCCACACSAAQGQSHAASASSRESLSAVEGV